MASLWNRLPYKLDWPAIAAAVLLAPFAFVCVAVLCLAFFVAGTWQPGTGGSRPTDDQMIDVAASHRAALDDLLRMSRSQPDFFNIDVKANTYVTDCEPRACSGLAKQRFDPLQQPWKRFADDLGALRAAKLYSGYEDPRAIRVLVWKGRGWHDVPEKGYMWSSRPLHCDVPSTDDPELTCMTAYHAIGGNWYIFSQ